MSSIEFRQNVGQANLYIKIVHSLNETSPVNRYLCEGMEKQDLIIRRQEYVYFCLLLKLTIWSSKYTVDHCPAKCLNIYINPPPSTVLI